MRSRKRKPKLYISRDNDPSDDTLDLYAGKPRKTNYGFTAAKRGRYVEMFNVQDWETATGIILNPGEGPVEIEITVKR